MSGYYHLWIVAFKMSILPQIRFKRLIVLAMWIAAASSKELDVCNYDSAKATCAENEVIQIEQASFGRMEVGQCIPKDLGYLGCQVDVLGYLESVCSGKQICKLTLPDANLIKLRPCERGVESYLHLKYMCITVHTSSTPCNGKAIAVQGLNGTLANWVTEQTGHGSAECPWAISGTPGQRIRLTVHNYRGSTASDTNPGSESNTNHLSMPGICYIYARITEESTDGSYTLCGDETQKNLVYTSKTASVKLTMTDPKHTQTSLYFLLHFEIIGCPDYATPAGAVIERRGHNIKVSCPDSRHRWQMSCNGTHWNAVGKVENCSAVVLIPPDAPISAVPVLESGELTLTHVFAMIIIVSVSVLIAVIIVGTAIVCRRRQDQAELASAAASKRDPEKYASHQGYVTHEMQPMLAKNQRMQSSHRQREYSNTLPRHLAGPPGEGSRGGDFLSHLQPPQFSPPPAPMEDSARNCSVHRTLGRNHRDRDDSTLKRPDLVKNHFYHELDPEHIGTHTETPMERTTSEAETLKVNRPVSL